MIELSKSVARQTPPVGGAGGSDKRRPNPRCHGVWVRRASPSWCSPATSVAEIFQHPRKKEECDDLENSGANSNIPTTARTDFSNSNILTTVGTDFLPLTSNIGRRNLPIKVQLVSDKIGASKLRSSKLSRVSIPNGKTTTVASISKENGKDPRNKLSYNKLELSLMG
ncbi:Unknown protein [Striga hermonthica]|uniref:Uncharacterized protein n=1 Tax=Striga hermonthica TaxID=68872 RepID=A0A9N7MHI7_STRHE|nr:Unknown protein [Striga hermonthica]